VLRRVVAELEDLEDVDEVDARGNGEQRDRSHHQRPTEVIAAMVVGVRDELQGDGDPSEH
jgi:hypothetical protein